MPTFNSASKEASSYAEKEMMKYWTEIARIYKDAYSKINKEVQSFYSKVLTGIPPENYYNEAIKFDRLLKLQKKANTLYTSASIKAGIGVLDSNKTAFLESYYRNSYVLNFFSGNKGVRLDFVKFDNLIEKYGTKINATTWKSIQEAALTKKALIPSYTPQSGTLVERLVKWRSKEIQKINQVINQGLLRGDNYQKTAKGIRQIIGIEGDRGAAFKSLRIAQTEGTKLLNAGNYMASLSAYEQGVPLKKRWLASLDSATRETHAELDGQEVEINDPFEINGMTAMYPGDFGIAEEDIECRCTYIDIIEGMSPEVRTAYNEESGQYEYFEWKNYSEWAAERGR